MSDSTIAEEQTNQWTRVVNELTVPRRLLLEEAANLIDGARNHDYGEPVDDFSCTAVLLQTYLDRITQTRGKLRILPHDIAVIMALVKVSRLAESPDKKDHWPDIAGYAGCGWDCVEAQSTPS